MSEEVEKNCSNLRVDRIGRMMCITEQNLDRSPHAQGRPVYK